MNFKKLAILKTKHTKLWLKYRTVKKQYTGRKWTHLSLLTGSGSHHFTTEDQLLTRAIVLYEQLRDRGNSNFTAISGSYVAGYLCGWRRYHWLMEAENLQREPERPQPIGYPVPAGHSPRSRDGRRGRPKGTLPSSGRVQDRTLERPPGRAWRGTPHRSRRGRECRKTAAPWSLLKVMTHTLTAG